MLTYSLADFHEVVSFLAQMCMEEDTGSIKRMYQVCKEFERITKAVLTRAEKEMSVRQRRRLERDEERLNNSFDSLRAGQKRSADAALQTSARQVNGVSSINTAPVFVPDDSNDFGSDAQAASGALPQYSSDGSGAILLSHALRGDIQTSDTPHSHYHDDFSFASQNEQGNRESSMIPSAVDPGAFQEPFLPPDFWSMPMTFEWDWANFSNTLGEDG